MATCRVIIAEGMRAAKALGVGDEATIDELTVAVEALQNLTLDIHESRVALLDVDVPGAYVFPCNPCDPCQPPPPPVVPPGPITWIPSENQRIRVQAGYDVEVLLPNSIPLFNTPDPYDYGFNANTVAPATGSTGVADGIEYRQPRDGVRIEIVATTQAIYFYRADLNAWMAATGLAIDTELPFSNRYNSALGALLAERLIEVLPSRGEPTPGLARRIARARVAIFTRIGVQRDAVVNDYF